MLNDESALTLSWKEERVSARSGVIPSVVAGLCLAAYGIIKMVQS